MSLSAPQPDLDGQSLIKVSSEGSKHVQLVVSSVSYIHKTRSSYTYLSKPSYEEILFVPARSVAPKAEYRMLALPCDSDNRILRLDISGYPN